MMDRQICKSALWCLVSLAVFYSSLSDSGADATPSGAFPQIAADIGLLINFSVPCDLNSAIAVPDGGGLLTTGSEKILLGIGSQVYQFDGSSWVYTSEQAVLLNKTLQQVGHLFSNSTAGHQGVTFQIQSFGATTIITAAPVVSVPQPFAIPLQLLNVSSTSEDGGYTKTDYVQRFGTIQGLPPAAGFPAKKGNTFTSRFYAFYAFYLPFNLSPQLATRVPRCGDERFYGLQFGRTFP